MKNHPIHFVCRTCDKTVQKFSEENKSYYTDINNNKLQGNNCYECKPRIFKEKKQIIRDPLNTLRQVKCSCCNETKSKINIGYYPKNSSFLFADENGERWKGKLCPSCAKEYDKEYRSRLPKKQKETKNCQNCNKEFLAESKVQIFCSKECSRSANNKKNYEKHKATYISKKKPKQAKVSVYKFPVLHKSTCLSCSKEIYSKVRKRQYCSKKCGRKSLKEKLKRKEYSKKYTKTEKSKVARKKRNLIQKFKQKLSKPFKQEILKIYGGRPEGYQVDHIVPINHADVCGLHVPWNMQYLSSDDNLLKSNKFDGTMENISWKE